MRGGFSSYKVDDLHPAPAVSLPSVSMSSHIAEQNGTVKVRGEATVYAFWEAFSSSDIKIEMKMVTGDGQDEKMYASDGSALEWSCFLVDGEETFPQDSLEEYILGSDAIGDGDNDKWGSNRKYIDTTESWVKRGCVELFFYTNYINLEENSGKEYTGYFQIAVSTTN